MSQNAGGSTAESRRERESESEWTRRVCKRLEELGAKVHRIVAGRMQEPGWPDRWTCHPVWHGHLEFKGVDTKLTTLQKITIREVNKRQPGTAFVVRKTSTCAPDSGRVEDHDSKVLWEFSSAEQLLLGLHHLREHFKHTQDDATAFYLGRLERLQRHGARS